ncbi:MAG: hypothetical protein A2W00_03535 [Candidatus Eisenbacteria bacterium RBG_16_71_46]|nr:MAG: hypothetical protein A2W00_03535 [Candidatus Eisenbacteria bacterium RBG_16_71_46]OGF21840.1 MAG: hypothetical protein A2V63_13880 [Candidatus Eisenbacteria bacterium RBG_19FT_COMBO_70_11]
MVVQPPKRLNGLEVPPLRWVIMSTRRARDTRDRDESRNRLLCTFLRERIVVRWETAAGVRGDTFS